MANTLLPSLPASSPGRSAFGACVISNNLYVVGGHRNETLRFRPDNFSSKVDIFNLTTKTWTTPSGILPRPRASEGFEVVAFNNRYIYAFGGLVHHEYRSGQDSSDTYETTSAIDRLDLQTNTWTTVGYLNQARSSYAIGVVDSKVYLLGGWYANPNIPYGGYYLDSVEEFDLKTETATLLKCPPMPAPLRHACASVTVGDEIVIIGGMDQPGMMSSQVVGFKPKNLSSPWNKNRPQLPQGILAPAAGYDPQKKAIYTFGGFSGKAYSTAVYELTQGSSAWKELTKHMKTGRGFLQAVLMAPGAFGLLGGAVGQPPPQLGTQSAEFEEYYV